MTNVLKLINTISQAENHLRQQEFVAPLLKGGRARIRVSNLVYDLTVQHVTPGWWICRAQNARNAEVVGDALPWQRGDYLALWPTLRLVLLEPLGECCGTFADWAALPLNASDAMQRFSMHGPLIIRLVEGGQPFDRVIGRVEGATVWYDAPDNRADPATAEALRAALAAGHWEPGRVGLMASERQAYRLRRGDPPEATTDPSLATPTQVHMPRVAGRLEQALTVGGAVLLGYQPYEHGLRVTWERAGRRHVTLVNNQLEVISAGVCLSGDDHLFDLASVVGVVADSPQWAIYED